MKLTPLLFLLIFFSGAIFSAASLPLQSDSEEDILSAIESAVKNKTGNKPMVTSLASALKSPTTSIRVKERAAWALGELNATSEAPALIEGANHKSLLVRSASLNALIQMRSSPGLPVYIGIAQNDPVFSLRQRGVVAIGLLRSEKAVDALVKASMDEREEIRGVSCLAMGATHSKKNDFTEILKEMEKDKSPYVKERASLALEAAQYQTTKIRAHLTHADEAVRLFGALYLHRFGRASDLKFVNDASKKESSNLVKSELTQAARAINRRIEIEKERKRQEELKKQQEEKARQEKEGSPAPVKTPAR